MGNARGLGRIMGFFCRQRGEAAARTCCGELQPVELAVDAADLAATDVNPPANNAMLCTRGLQTYSTTKDILTPRWRRCEWCNN